MALCKQGRSDEFAFACFPAKAVAIVVQEMVAFLVFSGTQHNILLIGLFYVACPKKTRNATILTKREHEIVCTFSSSF